MEHITTKFDRSGGTDSNRTVLRLIASIALEEFSEVFLSPAGYLDRSVRGFAAVAGQSRVGTFLFVALGGETAVGLGRSGWPLLYAGQRFSCGNEPDGIRDRR